MPGAWEFSRPQIVVAILTREIVSTKWAQSFRNMQLPPGCPTTFLHGMPFDHARNTACETALREGFDWLFFLDDDVAIPPDTVTRLASHGKDIVSGLYYRRAQPIVPVMLRYDSKQVPQWISQWQTPGQLLEVDMVGAGCLLIHRRVLERVPSPWFHWQLDDPNPELAALPGGRLSEDFFFCRKARQYGFSSWVDTSIVCSHVGLGESRMEAGGTFTPSAL